MLISTVLLVYLCLTVHVPSVWPTPVATPNWEVLISTNGVKFTGRNAHASCVFKGRIWVTGGRVASYTMYNLLESFKMADVWWSENGAIWARILTLKGDFYAQNTEVVQPGDLAPWYQRYAHSLNAVDIDGDGEPDVMVLAGGFASSPMNDVWVTADGEEWIYAGQAPWAARAWHSTAIFQGKLWLMGGTPLNNEVWSLDSLVKTARTRDPLTRAMFADHTYSMQWTLRAAHAAWSPRVGMGLIAQHYFDASKQNHTAARERLLLIGGYGGYPEDGDFGNETLYDGFYCRADTWESYNGSDWRLINSANKFGGRAWMALALQRDTDPRIDPRAPRLPPKVYLFGGGYIGFDIHSKKRVTSMIARADAFYTRDGVTWTKINHEEGGGTTAVTYFSSQEWARTVVDTNTQYLGIWGHSVVSFNLSTKNEYPGELFFIAGDYSGGGGFSNAVYKNLPGLHCDQEGVACSGRGACNVTGCVCSAGWAGQYCETETVAHVSAAFSRHAQMSAITPLAVLLSLSLLWI